MAVKQSQVIEMIDGKLDLQAVANAEASIDVYLRDKEWVESKVQKSSTGIRFWIMNMPHVLSKASMYELKRRYLAENWEHVTVTPGVSGLLSGFIIALYEQVPPGAM
jgi:hypothetical protein